MLRKVFFIFILSIPIKTFAARANVDPYNQPIANEQLANEKIRLNLSRMDVGKVLKLDESKGPIADDTAPRRLTSLYWVHTLNKMKDGVEVPKYTELDENLPTLIPQAFNNITTEVVERDWGNGVQPSEEEIEKWKKENPSPLLKYVSESGSGKKSFKSIDEMTYHIAFKIYQIALDDRERIKEHLRINSQGIDTDIQYQALNDKLIMSLTDFLLSQNKLKFEMGMQKFVQQRQRISEKAPSRSPASTGEHNNSIQY